MFYKAATKKKYHPNEGPGNHALTRKKMCESIGFHQPNVIQFQNQRKYHQLFRFKRYIENVSNQKALCLKHKAPMFQTWTLQG